MTTTASKHGLRKAATERRNKHAQRTPLPPKAGSAGAKAIEDARATLPDGTTTKSYAKAIAFIHEVEKSGWSGSTNSTGEETEVTASRGNETLYLRWLGGVFQHPATYTIADRTVQMRNASQAKQYAARAPEEGEKELQRVVSNKAFKKRDPERPKRVRLPFDPKLSTDEEVITALLGQGVSWINRISNGTESAIVGRDSHKVRISVSSSGERIFNFCCPATGYRSFRVTDVVRVGRGARTARAKNVEVDA